jgi:nitrogen fixation/metabolism regulation signal transduction histidine kinase
MAAAMEEALQKMRAQERAMQARAEASERLSGEIIASMTSGLLVVSQEGMVRTLNPAGRHLIGLPDSDWTGDYREVLRESTPLADVIHECLVARRPIVRRTVKMDRGAGATHLGITVSPIRDESGHEHGAICLFSDLSEVADLEDQLRLKDSLARLGDDRWHCSRIPQRAGDHPWIQPALDLERLPADFRPYAGYP